MATLETTDKRTSYCGNLRKDDIGTRQCVMGWVARVRDLGSLIFIAFSIAKLPYAGLIAVMTGFCAFIPYVGAFIACFIGTLLTLLSSPSQALLCILVYMAVQFVENQFIYPNVVGSSVGLPPLFTLLAVMLGGKLLGLIGMIFFIPLMAVVYSLVREDVQRRDTVKPIPRDSKFSPRN